MANALPNSSARGNVNMATLLTALQGLIAQNSQGSQGKLKTSEIGYFHPDAEDHEDEDFWTAGADTYYRDVLLFTERLKDITNSGKPWESIRPKLPQCLRGMATEWYASMNHDEKDELRQLEFEPWTAKLINEFHNSMGKALRSLQSMKYSLDDAIDEKSIRHYVHTARRTAKQAKIEAVETQLTMIMSTIDPELQATMPAITSLTTVKDFIDEAESRADLWRSLALSRKEEHQLPQSWPQAPFTYSAPLTAAPQAPAALLAPPWHGGFNLNFRPPFGSPPPPYGGPPNPASQQPGQQPDQLSKPPLRPFQQQQHDNSLSSYPEHSSADTSLPKSSHWVDNATDATAHSKGGCWQCWGCGTAFEARSKLHKHIPKCDGAPRR